MKQESQLTNEELASFCSQMAILLHAGIAPVESLRILLSDTTDPASRKLIEDILKSVSEGNSFSESIGVVGVFPKYVTNTLKLGEEAGSVDDVMSSLADYYDRETQISDSIKSAITYPFLMIVMMLVVIVILITRVLPIFNQVFVQLGAEMTGFAASLMKLGNTLNNYSVAFMIVLALLVVLYIFFSHTAAGRKAGRKISSKLFKDFSESVAVGRFASGMALALSSGLDTFSGLDMVRELVEDDKTRAKIDIIKASISKGNNFAEALKDGQIFSNVNNRMVAVGFKSGEIEKVMRRIADEYERKSEKKMNEMISVIEPTLVIILSLIVGLILLSVILPLMGVMATIG